ncbi:phage holin family protein [Butyricicoccus sp. Marseille-Q5471]|uniref:phage holin family protein n=1 Tax=Butyricicoccus sp. Marseille-Q5471 TaxID=3039493 RepID=UPI0024BC3AA9|nr:phage holin family protein [Butyricicoccus sp. Marseille-Q5471]
MDKLMEAKLWFTGFAGLIALKLGAAFWPIIIMIGCSLFDYGTGLIAAKFRGMKIDSNVGIKGIVKKVCMWLLVVVGAVIDWVIVFMGMDLPVSSPVAVIVAVWIIANELISILENLHDVGVPMPEFLMKIAELVKTSAKVNVPDAVTAKEE